MASNHQVAYTCTKSSLVMANKRSITSNSELGAQSFPQVKERFFVVLFWVYTAHIHACLHSFSVFRIMRLRQYWHEHEAWDGMTTARKRLNNRFESTCTLDSPKHLTNVQSVRMWRRLHLSLFWPRGLTRFLIHCYFIVIDIYCIGQFLSDIISTHIVTCRPF